MHMCICSSKVIDIYFHSLFQYNNYMFVQIFSCFFDFLTMLKFISIKGVLIGQHNIERSVIGLGIDLHLSMQ